MTEPKDDQLFELLFHQLVLSLSETTMVQLGKIMHPVSQKLERDLTQARSTIDLLRMLQARTKGNLTEQEQKLLDQSVLSLQMNYVYEQDQDRKGGPASPTGGKPAAEEKPAEGRTAPTGGGEATPPPAQGA
jgi:hypothetical protein